MNKEEYEEFQKTAEFETHDYQTYIQIATKYSGKNAMTVEEAKLKQKKLRSFYSDYVERAHKEAPEFRNNLEERDRRMANEKLPYVFSWFNDRPDCIYDKMKNQGDCGSCFAVGTVFAFNSRVCIQDEKNKYVEFSPQDVLECDNSHYGCNGGFESYIWNYLEDYGVCAEKCKPYYSGYTQNIGHCYRQCEDTSYPYYRFYARRYSLKSFYNVEDIKREIYYNGPITATMNVRYDFYSYKGGIYRSKVGSKTVEPHVVSLIGWSDVQVEGSTGIWYGANSWGKDWGKDGIFAIYMDDSDIAEDAMASVPDI